ncbi:MAG: YhbD family protein [Oscillospiraceae bacterium]|nr:YhbD family protein [Oscillospiraceae bacterium]
MTNETDLSGYISKSDILKRYGISYGSLYRWKRMGLIPEEWFIKMSVPSGQETFFREDVICPRIDEIIWERDHGNLEDFAGRLSPEEERRPVMVLETRFEKKTVKLEDIVSVIIDTGYDVKDITESLAELIRSIFTEDERGNGNG